MDQRTQPKISILMCVYNEEKFINDAIDSVLSQSYKNFQLIIINDGSNDKTQDIIQEYSNDKRVQSYNPGRIGKIKANNLAFSKGRGQSKLLAFKYLSTIFKDCYGTDCYYVSQYSYKSTL